MKQMIERINFLAKKKKEVGLTEEETKEQKELYQKYLANFRKYMTRVLDNTVIERPDGTKEKLKRSEKTDEH